MSAESCGPFAAPVDDPLPPVLHVRHGTPFALSYFWYDNGMAVSKVSLSLDEEVLAEARERAGRRELSSYVNDALRRRLQHDRLGDLLAEMDVESGPVPEDLLDEARRVWQHDAPQRRRRRPA
jgi:Arc/MetJ family transcription regulator